jgi:streptogramin lyase
VARCTPGGVITEYAIPSGRTAWAIAAGPDGNVWFAGQSAGRVNLDVVADLERFPVPALSPRALVLLAVALVMAGLVGLRSHA